MTGPITDVRVSVFLAVVAAAIGAVGWGRARSVEVPRWGAWEDTPIVCPNEGVNLAQLHEAAEWWRGHGFPMVEGCDRWTISVDVDPTLTELGHTTVHQDGEVVIAAEIRVVSGDVGALVYAHELGHALALGHPTAAPSGHILHPTRPGWDGRGLR